MSKSLVEKRRLKSSKKKAINSRIGAPSQVKQPSRKGKRAWRKNIDIQEVEEGMEETRVEQRVTGTTIHAAKDEDLFQIDVKGDTQIRKSLPRFSVSQLKSTQILNQRSAIPAVSSRVTSSKSTKRKSTLTSEEKARLLRIAKRPRKGPFNSIVDPTEFGAGSANVGISEAVKNSGKYDPWLVTPQMEETKDGLESVHKKPIKAPKRAPIHGVIQVPAIAEPHQGTSYNPPAQSYQELLLQAHEKEEKKARDAQKHADIKEKMEKAIAQAEIGEDGPTFARGMKVDKIEDEDDSANEDNSVEVPSKRQPQRKTKAQRKKAADLLAQKRQLAEQAARKRMLATIPSIKAIRRTNQKLSAKQEQAFLAKRAVVLAKLKRRGLAGRKIGRHIVPEVPLDVQLGEDLSESFRALKPEGNLFRDRFLNMQQRALIEPRVPVLPKKRTKKEVAYEKHAWKRFE